MTTMTNQGILLASGTNELEIIEAYIDEKSGARNYFGINVAKIKEIINMPERLSSPPNTGHCTSFPASPAIRLTVFRLDINTSTPFGFGGLPSDSIRSARTPAQYTSRSPCRGCTYSALAPRTSRNTRMSASLPAPLLRPAQCQDHSSRRRGKGSKTMPGIFDSLHSFQKLGRLSHFVIPVKGGRGRGPEDDRLSPPGKLFGDLLEVIKIHCIHQDQSGGLCLPHVALCDLFCRRRPFAPPHTQYLLCRFSRRQYSPQIQPPDAPSMTRHYTARPQYGLRGI